MAKGEHLSDKIAHYKISPEAVKLVRDTPVVLLVGISGAGKDTLKAKLLQKYNTKYHPIVTHTTRKPRENQGILEVDGVDYHFIDFLTAESMLDSQGYIETNEYSHNIYGTSVAEIQLAHDEGRVALADIDVNGVAQFMAISDTVKPIFILPPDYKTWQKRLMQRYGNDHKDHSADIEKRMRTAKDELEHLLETNYYYLVVNKDIDHTVDFIHHLAQGEAKRVVHHRAEDMQVARDILGRLAIELAA